MTQYESTIKNCLRPKLGYPQKIEIRDRATSQNMDKTLRKINTTPKGPLQGNGMDAISKTQGV